MRRNWVIAAVVIGVLAIVAAAVVMRMSEEEPETTQDWADSVCSSFADWRASLSSLADLGDDPLTAETVRDRLAAAREETSDLAEQLRDLGPPDLEAGDDLQRQLDGVTAEFQASFASLEESAEAATDAPADELLDFLSDVAADFATLREELGEAIDTLRNSDFADESRTELEQAFAAAPSCQSLRAES